MSTVSSPRPSITSSRAHSPTPASSRRPSLDTLNTNVGLSLSASSTPSTARAVSPSLHPRRNRAALRDYYNLKPSAAEIPGARRSRSIPRPTDAADTSNPSVVQTGTELDSPDFDAQHYVNHLLATSSLSTVLKAENTLVGDIKTLDSERKALVYDNYSKLIRAVETIGKMRQSMDDRGAPLTMTKTLGPAIAFVAETAGGLIQEGEEQRRRMKEAKASDEVERKKAEKETVRWVLGTPARLEKLVADGSREEAEKDWEEVRELLQKWEGVKGVQELREACEKAMEKSDDAS
ncbi:Vps51/Vps67-domain-containing protein [Aspergillus pseudonomiae]|uniref:Vacuolar protein sorting-associated protein 51 homolog n=1 Tax=Aspergillus pseudonomiae TaxID=1506151 RepID=A0A5N7DLQ6_9EURO|nr:Vps51/Vps67-domain-containing protein [Aspergillus pseudonomiae]KAB8260235.1 Vps51/Vps67-domain-containing protein [Aspergillus pseudonomiae]KAE8407235.1 Vps51/Vps67-domain-containing protein [Aspergillus pseudonomiae]